MRNEIHLLRLEVIYLLRQKFLWIMLLLGAIITLFRMPRFDYELNYKVFAPDYGERTEAEQAIVDYWNVKKAEVLEKRSALAQKASKLKEDLSKEHRYEREYYSKIEKYYGQDLKLESQDYLGWEIFFQHQTDMSPHNPLGLLCVIIIGSAGLLLLTKDIENKTFFWASITGKGTVLSSFMNKLLAVFLYGIFIQVLFDLFYILWLWLVTGLDMRHWFHLIQNIPQFGTCDLHLTILQVIGIDIFLKDVVGVLLFLFVFLFANILKRYIFMYMSLVSFSGFLYYGFYTVNEQKNYDFLWRVNPFHVFHLDKALTYNAVEIMNHAVDIRTITLIAVMAMIAVLIYGAYLVWRKYLHVNLL